jgi:formylglycine-generating enzyme required for sulfatase activity
MTSMEYEKACRGPALQQADEYAWGTAQVASTTYVLQSASTPAEIVNIGYVTDAGNANYNATSAAVDGPMRAGIFSAHPDNTGRMTAGATYHGIMEMSGNLREYAADLNSDVTYGTHGDGALSVSGAADAFVVASSSGAFGGLGTRGGSWDMSSDFMQITRAGVGASSPDSRQAWAGIRCIRSAP